MFDTQPFARRGHTAIPLARLIGQLSEEQIRALHQRIEPAKYRVALLCDQNIAGGFCAGHVPEFWRLRAICRAWATPSAASILPDMVLPPMVRCILR